VVLCNVLLLIHLSRPWSTAINYWAYKLFCICYLFCSKRREAINNIIWKYLLIVGSNLSGIYSSGDQHRLCVVRRVYWSLNLRTRLFEQSVPQIFANGKAAGQLVYHSSPSSVEIRSEWSCTSAHPVRLHGADRDNFIFLNLGQGNGFLFSSIFNRNSKFYTTSTIIITLHLIQDPGIFRFVVHDLVFSYLAVLTYWLLSCSSLFILIFVTSCNFTRLAKISHSFLPLSE
jgi:hypothetical protein